MRLSSVVLIMWNTCIFMTKAHHYQVANVHIMVNILFAINYVCTYVGAGYELIDATGVIIVGHFSIDGQLKEGHYTTRHHNMVVVSSREELMEKIVLLLSYSGQTVLQLIVNEHELGEHIDVDMHFNIPCSS